MTLQETKDIVIKWIQSCETSEQLDLLLEVMQKFVFERFAGRVVLTEYDQAKTDLKQAWTDQRLMIVVNNHMNGLAIIEPQDNSNTDITTP